MATDFRLIYSGSVTPIEAVTLSDAVDVSRVINSNVDKVLASTIEKSFGSAATEIRYKSSYTTTTSGVALSHSTILNASVSVGFLFIKITGAGSSGTPDCSIAIDGGTNYSIKLSGIGDFCMIPLDDNIYGVPTTEVLLISSGATTVADVEIIIGVL